jgi:hypothetical protein
MPGLVPGIHVFRFGQAPKTWTAGTSPAMTTRIVPMPDVMVQGEIG